MVVKKKPVVKKKTVVKKKDSGGGVLSLPQVLDITCAESFYSDLKKIAVPGAKIAIDAKKTEKVTTPAVQLLLAAYKTVKSKKGNMVVKNPSKELQKIFSTLGLDSQLNEWK